MKKNNSSPPPVWLFMILAIGCAWASGIYLGKITLAGTAGSLALKSVAFGVVSLVMGVCLLFNGKE
ncbi:MAG: hypothetical protein JXA25_09160 [Anaerolineales bacterium]|nr:hypothetical protein [Anaerolineales bacterium]